MALNFPGPQEIRIFYSVQSFEHIQRLNVDVLGSFTVGQDPATIQLDSRDGTDPFMDTFVDSWIALIDALYNTAQTAFSHAELWDYAPGTFDASFVTTYSIGATGDSASPTVVAGESIYTFRTEEGGILKVTFEEPITSPGGPLPYTALNATQQGIVDYVLSDDNVILARDTSYPIAFKRAFPGTNEAIFKKRYRP